MDTPALITRLETRFADPGNAIYSSADWLDYLNDAWRWVQAASPWWPMNEIGTTVAFSSSQSEASIDAFEGYDVSLVLNQTDGYLLEPIANRTQHRYEVPDPLEEGSPRWYRMFGNVIQLIPVPSDPVDIYIEYEGFSADLNISGTDPQFPAKHHSTLIEYALYLAYIDDDDPESAAAHMERANTHLEALKMDLLGTRTAKNPQFVDDWFGG